MTVEIVITGAVQGVGYRPFVAKLAEELNICGEVRNSGGIVRILASAKEERIAAFAGRLQETAPEGASVLSASVHQIPEREFSSFRIVESSVETGAEFPVFPADIGICSVCEQQMMSKADRRCRYPLISCASCGPRWSILRSLPYDRDTTTMDAFKMCPDCEDEYTGRLDRLDRRRHAQTISCHHCGPQMILRTKSNRLQGEEAFDTACHILKSGGIVALKGVGGYQYLASPFREDTIDRLRMIKGREKKPFAMLFSDVEMIRSYCVVSSEEETLLKSSARPIVLLNLREKKTVSEHPNQDTISGIEAVDKNAEKENVPRIAGNVSGESRYLGAMLPAAGIQRLLTDACGPLVATSANLSGEPIPIRDDADFRGDAVYYHEREILRPLDDSVTAVIGGKTSILRRSRGYVPMPVLVEAVKDGFTEKEPVLFAAGGDLKSAFCIYKGSRAILSQYFGDLEDYAVQQNYRRAIPDMEKVLTGSPELLVCDLHPGYYSTQLAEKLARQKKLPLIKVQHHLAHVASVMAEHHLEKCIGIALDGTGYGTDGAIWGGELFYVSGATFDRLGHLSYVRLVGGDETARSGARAAECYLLAAVSEGYLSEEEAREALFDMKCAEEENVLREEDRIRRILLSGQAGVDSSSAGRLFDAVSSLLGIRSLNSYEGECAIALENAAAAYKERFGRQQAEEMKKNYFRDLILVEDAIRIDQLRLITGVIAMRRNGCNTGLCALTFHLTLAGALYDAVQIIRVMTGETKVCLSGGVFANRILRKELEVLLRMHRFGVYWNESVPGNDGGISLGQAWIARRRLTKKYVCGLSGNGD